MNFEHLLRGAFGEGDEFNFENWKRSKYTAGTTATADTGLKLRPSTGHLGRTVVAEDLSSLRNNDGVIIV